MMQDQGRAPRKYADILDLLHDEPMPLYTAIKLWDIVSETCELDPYLSVKLGDKIYQCEGARLIGHTHAKLKLLDNTPEHNVYDRETGMMTQTRSYIYIAHRGVTAMLVPS